MKRWSGIAVAAMLLAPAATHAQVVVPSVECLLQGDILPTTRSLFARVMVGSVTLDLTQCLRGSGKVHQLAADFILAGVGRGRVTATYNEDPFINFGIVTTNLVVGPVDYMFTFSTPIVPGLYDNATSSLSGSVTAGQGTATTNNTGTIPFVRGYGTLGGVRTPAAGPNSGNLGVDVGSGPCTTPNASVNCPSSPAAGANTFAPRSLDDLEATVTYSQSGLQSQTSFTGRVDVFSTIPEPATLSLFAIGAAVIGVGGLVRRRRA